MCIRFVPASWIRFPPAWRFELTATPTRWLMWSYRILPSSWVTLMFRLQMLFDSGETVRSRPVTSVNVVFRTTAWPSFRERQRLSQKRAFEAQSHRFRTGCLRFVTLVTDTQRKTHFRLLVRCYRAGFSPAGSRSKVSDSITFHLPPSPSFLAQSPFLLRFFSQSLFYREFTVKKIRSNVLTARGFPLISVVFPAQLSSFGFHHGFCQTDRFL